MVKRLLATASVVGAVVIGGVVTASPASAFQYQCTWGYPANGVSARCSAPAGNQFRVLAECRSGDNGRIVRAYGQWRNATGTNWSTAICAAGDAWTGAGYIEGRQA